MNTENTSQEQEVIMIQEEKDGSATVELPSSIPSPEAQVDDANIGTDEDDDAERAAEIAQGGAVDEAAERFREQKRQKRRARKVYHKQASVEKDVKLTLLERQNANLLERLSVLEKKSHGSDIARVNSAIASELEKINFAKGKMAEATRSGNGELQTAAQEMWFESRRKHEALVNLKNNVTKQPKQRTIQPVDASIQRYANEWMQEHDWYDPAGGNQDSKVALAIDQVMGEEGYDPKTGEYWTELNRRLRKTLPHRYTGDNSERPRAPSRPRNVVTASNRENVSSSGGSNTFTLSPEQVRAMKDAGMWDDGEKRAKMIRRYALEARNN